MNHTHKTSKSGLYIVIGIVILLGAIYMVSTSNLFARNNKNEITKDANSSCVIGSSGLSCGPVTTSTDMTLTETPSSANQATTSATTTSVPTANVAVTYETVNVGHTAFALNPETVTLKAGKSYKLVVTPTENGGGCMNTMTIPRLDENIYPVRAGQAVTITIDNVQAGSYEVVCGAMGMYQGSIVVK